MELSVSTDIIQSPGQCEVVVFIIGAKEVASKVPICLATICPKPILHIMSYDGVSTPRGYTIRCHQRTNTSEVRRPVRAPTEEVNGTNMPREKTPSRGPPTIPNSPIAA